MPYDVAIVGGGIVGLATALALRDPAHPASGGSLLVLEAESRIATHQTGHNSGVIHSGLYYRPGSLKAKNCALGRTLLYQFCREHGIAHEQCGKIVVATADEELPRLDELEKRGRANGLEGIRRLNADDIQQFEPHARGLAGLHVPQTGIVDFRQVATKMAELVTASGGEVRTDWKLRRVIHRGREITLITSGGDTKTRLLINCAGLHSDRVARKCGLRPDVRIVPFRGEYYELVPQRRNLVRNLIYPVPDPAFPFLGVHFSRTIGGRVEAGPNAVLAWSRHGYRRTDISFRDSLEMLAYGGFWRMALGNLRMGLGETWRSWCKRAFVKALRRLVPELQAADIVRAGSGVRAQAVAADGTLVDDFRIERGERMIHVLNAPSPAATSALAIGRTLAEMAKDELRIA